MLGLASRDEMAARHGGFSGNQRDQDLVTAVGTRIVNESDVRKSKYPFEFHVLADTRTVNAFALPGGQIFVTSGLLNRLQTFGGVPVIE